MPTPGPPYYAAIITVEWTEDDNGYFAMADAVYEAAAAQDGFPGMEWAYDTEQRVGIRHPIGGMTTQSDAGSRTPST